ncbi:hypothetical protein ACJJTC_018982 [Scirpophaga incertulas]
MSAEQSRGHQLVTYKEDSALNHALQFLYTNESLSFVKGVGGLSAQEAAEAEAKLVAERRQREAEARAAARAARREARARRLEAHFADLCPALMLPHAQKYLRKLSDALDHHGLLVSDKCPLLVGAEGGRRLAAEEPALGAAPALAALAERPALALLLRKAPDNDGDLIELCRRCLFGDGLDEEARQKCLSEELTLDGVPGLFVPADRHQRAAALDLLFPKMVGALVEPPVAPEPPHVAVVVGAWQRRAVMFSGGHRWWARWWSRQ